jgi:hypothetical protein
LGTVPSSTDVWNIPVIAGVITLAKLFSNLGEQFKSAYSQEDLTNSPDVGRNTIPKLPEIRGLEKGVLKLLQNMKVHKAAGPDIISPIHKIDGL